MHRAMNPAVVVADGDEPIDIRYRTPNQSERARTVRLDQPLEEEIFTLQRAAGRAA